MNWSEEDLNKKMAEIIKKKSYGNDTVRIDDFFNDEKTYTYSEVKLAISRKITQMIRDAEKILEFKSMETDPRIYIMDFFKISDIEIKLAVADTILKQYRYERDCEIEDLMDTEISRLKEQMKLRRKRIIKFSLEKKKKIIKLLIDKGIIIANTDKEIEMFLKNIGIFAGDLTDEELKNIN